jgi:TetR/AcrR family transcriptional repressor of nem operon
MRYSAEHAETTRARMLDACERAFREHGYGGIGVEGLSRAAGVTTGAFYNHFGSKAGAFAAVVAAGVARFGAGLDHSQRNYGPAWMSAVATYYLGEAHRRDVAGGCALPSLSIDVSRADAETRAAFESELAQAATLLAATLPNGPDRAAAWPFLAQLVGGVVLSRAVQDEALAREIADSVKAAATAGVPQI